MREPTDLSMAVRPTRRCRHRTVGQDYMRLSAKHSPEVRRQKAVEYQRRLLQSRRERGVCMSCGRHDSSVRQHEVICLSCWFKHMAKHNTGTKKDGAMLRDLFEAQQRTCAYTGEVLIPGINASLDHKIPTSRGGTNDRENLQWVTARVNSMKSDLTHEEFVALCRHIDQAL
jgi:5-methylcytosine-specific restriction endonuclease McrA